MAAVSYNKFHDFGQGLLHGDINCSTDTLKIYLTATAPSASADQDKADLASITATGGYSTVGGSDTVNTLAEDTTSGIWKVGCTSSIVFTAATSLGTFPSFQYVVLYDDTTATGTTLFTDQLIAWWDYVSAVWSSAPGNGDTFTVSCTNNKLFTINSVS